MSQRVVVFAGAGASKAVNPRKYPTTIEFYEQLPESITGQPLFSSTVDSIMRTQNIEVIDIEVVLWELENLRKFFKSIVTRDGVLSHLLLTHNVLNTVVKAGGVGALHPGSQQILPHIEKLVSDVNRIVYRLYGHSPDDAELAENWLPLLQGLQRPDVRLDVFTTNYDVNIETALDVAFPKAGEHQYLGLTGRRHKTINLANWGPNAPERDVLLTKLHGSIDWKLADDAIFVGDPVFTGDHRKQAIIYPGFKGQSETPFFTAFHSHLERRLAEADAVVFIGFAFRDEHINQLIQRSLERRTRVLVINPDKSVEFPQTRASVRFERSNFDKRSANAAVQFVSEVLGKRKAQTVQLV